MNHHELSEFSDLSVESILDVLNKGKGKNFEISLPKDTQQFFSASRDIAIEFITAAYIGQLLSQCSLKFDYNPISPVDEADFIFFIHKADVHKLAEAISEAALGLGSDDEDQMVFHESIEQFIDDVENVRIIPVCKDFIDVYTENINKEQGDDEDDDGQLDT